MESLSIESRMESHQIGLWMAYNTPYSIPVFILYSKVSNKYRYGEPLLLGSPPHAVLSFPVRPAISLKRMEYKDRIKSSLM